MEFSANDIIERIKSKVSLKELEKIGFTPQNVSNWKTRNTIPRADDLYKIAQYIGVTVEWLLTGETDKDDSVYRSKYEKLLRKVQDFSALILRENG
ncbi:MAG: helix-turn-helix transcriptional regulator [Bacteroidales bacterium]|nr:helix-turn-helix transcriptional regulator [Candidatus Scybalousia scybalohippi]